MALANTVPGSTATHVLFGSGNDAIDTLTQSLESSSIVSAIKTDFPGLGQAGRKALAREVAVVVADLLNPEFGELLLGVWRKHEALIQAGQRTFEALGSRELVELLTHRITSTHRPSVDLSVDGIHLTTLNFELHLSFIVKGLVAAVSSGELVQIGAGDCDVSASLAVESIEIARGMGRFDLAPAVSLENPLRLWPHGEDL